MSFVWRNIAKIGERTWTYKTDDSYASIVAAGYFNRAVGKFAIGERIQVTRVSNIGLPTEAYLDSFDLVVSGEVSGTISTSTVSTGGGASSQIFDVTDYGAVGDGIVDDTVALQAAHDAAAAATPRGLVKLPIKTYRTTATVNLKASMFGDGGNAYNSSFARAVILPEITDGSAALKGIALNGADFRNFGVHPTLGGATPNPNPSGGNVQNCIGLQLGQGPSLITNITRANPGVVTTKYLHTFETGDVVNLDNVLGMSQVNYSSNGNVAYTVTRISATQFSIGVDTSGYTAYAGKGLVYPHDQGAAKACTRGVVEDVTISSCNVNFHLAGWLNKHLGLKSFNATLGFDGGYLNTNLLDLVTENCWQALELLGCNNLNILRLEDEGNNDGGMGANRLGASSTIDYSINVSCGMYSAEGSRSTATPWMTWGGISYSQGIYFPVGYVYAGGSGTRSIVIESVHGYSLPYMLGGHSVTSGSLPDAVASGVFNVKDFGAIGDNTTDDTAAIQAAINAAGSGGRVEFEGRTYRSGPLTVTGAGGVTLVGKGFQATRIRFVPTANNQTLLTIGNNGGAVCRCNVVQDLYIYTTDAVYNKTAIDLIDVGETRISNVYIGAFYGNLDLVGIRIRGRESIWVDHCQINATVQVRISANPNTSSGYLSADHVTFTNTYLNSETYIPATLVSANVLIDSGVHVSQLQFCGGAWVGGRYGLYWNDTANVAPPCTGIRLENVRTEQGVTPGSYWSVYISVNDATGVTANKVLNNFSAVNCEFENARNGIYLRNVFHASIDSCVLEQAGAVVIMDVADCFGINWNNNRTSASAGASAIAVDTNLVFTESAPHVNGFPYPQSAQWTRRSTAATYAERPKREFSTHIWRWSESLASGAQVQLPCNADTNSWLHASIRVIATNVASNIIEYGNWHGAPVTGLTNGIVKAGGSTNTIAGDVAGNLCVYCGGASPFYAGVYVKNNLGVTCNVTIEVIGKRSVEN